MATYVVYFSDDGTPKTGLTLTWESIKKVSDGTDFTPQPTFTEVGGGWYKFTFSPTERLVGVIDGSATLSAALDRYRPVDFDEDDFGLIDLIDERLKGSQVLDSVAKTLTIKDRNDVTLAVFDLTDTTDIIKAYIERAPQ